MLILLPLYSISKILASKLVETFLRFLKSKFSWEEKNRARESNFHNLSSKRNLVPYFFYNSSSHLDFHLLIFKNVNHCHKARIFPDFVIIFFVVPDPIMYADTSATLFHQCLSILHCEQNEFQKQHISYTVKVSADGAGFSNVGFWFFWSGLEKLVKCKLKNGILLFPNSMEK